MQIKMIDESVLSKRKLQLKGDKYDEQIAVKKEFIEDMRNHKKNFTNWTA